MEYISNPERITYFAKTDARNKMIPFGIRAKDRTRHIYVIGKTGMGKSTCLENMAVQDIKNGEGFCFIDPHGATAEVLLDYIPKDRVEDVLYFAPFDLDHPISFNVMEDVGYDKRHLVVSGLMSAFKKIWVDAWSARMEYILNNTLLALLEYPDATMLGVNRMYTDKTYRKKVVESIKDPLVRSFWVDEFATYTDRYTQEATPAIQNKIGQFTGNPLIRNIVGQAKSTFDLRHIVDGRKILIVNLSKGKVGEQNANLLGSMLITKIYLAAMSRADVSPSTLARLPNFYFYVDEFQSFANESFADILSEARKYKLNLTMAHQYIEQMSEEVRNAVFGNVGTMMTFRVGAYDAEVLEKEFAPQFTAQDLVNLGFAQIYLKLMIDGIGSKPFSAETLPPVTRPEISLREEVIEYSRKTFGRPRADIEEAIREEHTSQRQIEMVEKKDRMQKEWQERRASWSKEGGAPRPPQSDGFPRRAPLRDEGAPRFTPREDRGERREFERREPREDEGLYGNRERERPFSRAPFREGEHVPRRFERAPGENTGDRGERRQFVEPPRPPQERPDPARRAAAVPERPALSREQKMPVAASHDRGPTEKNVSNLKAAIAQALKEKQQTTNEQKKAPAVVGEAAKSSAPREPVSLPKQGTAERPLSAREQNDKEVREPERRVAGEPAAPQRPPEQKKEIPRDVLENILRDNESRDEQS